MLSENQPISTRQRSARQATRVSRVSSRPLERTVSSTVRARIDTASARGAVGFSGAEGARTPDLFAASEALFQLSYSPGRDGELYRETRVLRGVGSRAVLVDVQDQVV